jgi:hypothetical protein
MYFDQDASCRYDLTRPLRHDLTRYRISTRKAGQEPLTQASTTKHTKLQTKGTPHLAPLLPCLPTSFRLLKYIELL